MVRGVSLTLLLHGKDNTDLDGEWPSAEHCCKLEPWAATVSSLPAAATGWKYPPSTLGWRLGALGWGGAEAASGHTFSPLQAAPFLPPPDTSPPGLLALSTAQRTLLQVYVFPSSIQCSGPTQTSSLKLTPG